MPPLPPSRLPASVLVFTSRREARSPVRLHVDCSPVRLQVVRSPVRLRRHRRAAAALKLRLRHRPTRRRGRCASARGMEWKRTPPHREVRSAQCVFDKSR